MSRQQQETDTQSRPRQRANTTSFPSFPWRSATRPRTDLPFPSPASPTSQFVHQSPSVESLIEALTPPSVPSLSLARSLASVLSTYTPLPRWDILNPVLDSLCNPDSPLAIQAAGYEIISAYWENHEAPVLTTADRVSYLALFLRTSDSWGSEIWEPRFKALRAFSKYGTDIIGIESYMIGILKSWITGGFEGLLNNGPAPERSERAERERCIDVLAKFLTDMLLKSANTARIQEDAIFEVTQFFSNLVDRSVPLPAESTLQDRVLASLTDAPSNAAVSHRPSSGAHRRNPSSISIPSTIATPSPAPLTLVKHPAEIAISLYLEHLSSQIKTVSHTYLNSVIPVLFRALAFCASPLPRLSVLPRPEKKSSLEDRITDMLISLFAGPYSTTCMLVLKQYLFPPGAFGSLSSGGEIEASWRSVQIGIMTSLGAHRIFRIYVRRALSTRLARAYISREAVVGYSHTGAPAHMEMELDLMERAWPKDDYMSASSMSGNGWDAGRLGKVLASSIEAWVALAPSYALKDAGGELGWFLDKEKEGKEKILEEAAGVLKDILQELDSREDDSTGLDEEEAGVVGETLLKLCGYILLLKNPDATPFIVPLSQPTNAPSSLLRTVSSLLARDHSAALTPLLSNILISIADHLSDADTARLPLLMLEQHDLTPTSPDWLENWDRLLSNPSLVSVRRPLTRHAVMDTLKIVYESVREMKGYRRPLADMVLSFSARCTIGDDRETDRDALWQILATEVVLRVTEEEGDENTEGIQKYVDLLAAIASDSVMEDETDTDTASVLTSETHNSSPPFPSSAASVTPLMAVSPALSRMQSEYHGLLKEKEKESGLPSVMSILSSFTTASRSQSQQPALHDEQEDETSTDVSRFEPPSVTRVIGALSGLFTIFSQLGFSPAVFNSRSLRLSIHVYRIILSILMKGKSERARLAALQFLVRLRADRDHRLYFVGSGLDPDGIFTTLATSISRAINPSVPLSQERPVRTAFDDSEVRKARARQPQDLDERRSSRSSADGPSRSAASRSRSRTTAYGQHISPIVKTHEQLWHIPEQLPFSVEEADSPSEGLVSYDPDGPERRLVLPISEYLRCMVEILEKEKSWEVLSYLLCHLPLQLSNKHLFCGPKSRDAISKMLSVLCTSILNGQLGFNVGSWPVGLKIRDAQGLAYHTLSVLVSYRRCFDLQQRHLLVEVFQSGLNGQLSTITCCLNALSLSAFELPSSMTKCLSRILEKLSQIMSNPNMAVHILGFLSVIGSLPNLYVNFTESDFKMVFGVALQYLQHYNRLNSSPTVSWALSQHVRILSYYVVYVWFLAIKLPDRPVHIRYITRQLLLANEGNEKVDGPTEVCFDWLSRYTYASADPRPTTSTFGDIVMSPKGKSDTTLNEKTWIIGNSVVTVRALSRLGWIEVLSRRPSGYSRFLCRLENVPLVGPGEVAPDLISIPAALIMERDTPSVTSEPGIEGASSSHYTPGDRVNLADLLSLPTTQSEPPVPDPITGYVWSGHAPSQRRKRVDVDPSFLVLQLSPYPDGIDAPNVKKITDSSALAKFISTLDRVPVIDTHKVGILYVAPGQVSETDILRNTHGSPAYTRFLEGIGRLINLRGQADVYAGGLDPNEDGEYAYAWWDDIGQILYHTATMMPTTSEDPQSNNKKRHIGNDYVRIIWNDSGLPYRFGTLTTQFQFVNIVIEPHSLGAIAAFSNSIHENEYFKVTLQRAQGMIDFTPVGCFKLISAENLPLLVRQLSLLSDWFALVFANTQNDTVRTEIKTNWHSRLESIHRFKNQIPFPEPTEPLAGVMGQEGFRDFTTSF